MKRMADDDSRAGMDWSGLHSWRLDENGWMNARRMTGWKNSWMTVG